LKTAGGGPAIKKERKIIAEARSQGKMPVNYVQKDEETDE